MSSNGKSNENNIAGPLGGKELKLTDNERAIIATITGGQELLEKLNLSTNPQDRISLAEEGLVGIDAARRGQKNVYLRRVILKVDSKGVPQKVINFKTAEPYFAELIENDVETNEEIIEVKGGDYSKHKKLIDREMTQFSNRRIYNKQKSYAGQRNNLPERRIIYAFTSIPNDTLIDWLQEKGAFVRIHDFMNPLQHAEIRRLTQLGVEIHER